MTKIANSFYMGSSLLFYNRYSRILYEGDEINLFGIAKYNQFQDAWEITKPIALMKGGVSKIVSHLSWE
jgi:hypothetical protein